MSHVHVHVAPCPKPMSTWMQHSLASGTLDNACGVIACLHAVYNNLGPLGGLPSGSILAEHLAMTLGATPAERATALESNASFQQVHQAKAAEGGSAVPQEQSEVRLHGTRLASAPHVRPDVQRARLTCKGLASTAYKLDSAWQ